MAPQQEPGSQQEEARESTAEQPSQAPPPPPPRGRPFVKGRSGNPAGRPPTRAYKAAYVAGALIQDKTVPLTRKLINLALTGDRAALRMCFDRIAPPRRESPLALDLPPLENQGEVSDAIVALVDAAGRGTMTVAQAAALARIMMTLLHPMQGNWVKLLLDRRRTGEATR